MSETAQTLEYDIRAVRIDAHGGMLHCKEAVITVDTDVAGRHDAFNPAELLLGALGACVLKGIERVASMLHFDLTGVVIRIHGVQQDVLPKPASIRYDIDLDTTETDQRIALIHTKVQQYGTVFNTVAPGTDLQGTMRRAAPMTA
jgi:uncharacterized OsmC-like protein